MTANFHVGDTGSVIELEVLKKGAILNISAATGLSFNLKSPSGALKPVTAVFSTDGTDGKLRYLTVVDDLDASGTWFAEAKFTLGGSITTSAASFVVDTVLS